MVDYNLGTARGAIEIDSGDLADVANDLKNADIVMRQTGHSLINTGMQAAKAFGYVISVGAKFEKELSYVQAITQATSGEIDELRQYALDLARDGPFGPNALAQAFVELAKAGVTADEIIGGVGKSITDLASAADIDTTAASDIVVQMMAMFNLAAEEVPRATDLIAGAANASIIDVQDFATTMKYAGPVASALGLTMEDLATTIALLGQSGIRGSQAGTSLRQMMLNLAGATPKATARMEQLGLITEEGTNLFYNQKGELKDLTTVFELLGDSLKGLSEKQKTEALRDIFGVRQMPTVLFLLEQGRKAFEDMNNQINDVTAADVAAERLDNLDGAVRKFKATLEATLVEAGSPFQKMLQRLVEGATALLRWFDALPDSVATFLLGALALVAVLSILSGVFLLTVGNIIRAARVIGELHKAFSILVPMIRAFTASLLTNPVFLIIAAIVLLGIALYAAYKNVKWFREAVDGAWQSFQRGWDIILNFIKNFDQIDWEGLGRSVVEGLIKGLESLRDEAVGWLGRLASDMWNGFLDFFGINSPSRLMMGAGRDIMMGLLMGLSSMVGAVSSFFVGVGKELFGPLWNQVERVKEGVESIFGGIGTGTVSGLGGVLDKVAPGAGGAAAAAPTGALRAASEAAEAAESAKKLPGLFGEAEKAAGGLQGILSKINLSGFISTLMKLPGQVTGIFLTMASAAGGFITRFAGILVGGAGRIVSSLFTLLLNLPAMVLRLFTGIIGHALWFSAFMIGLAIRLAWGFIRGLWGILVQLPSLILGILGRIIGIALEWLPQLPGIAMQAGSGFLTGLLSFITQLPGRMATIIAAVFAGLWNAVPQWFAAAVSLGQAIWDGIVNTISGLPDIVTGIFDKVLGAIRGLISSAFDAAKSWAGSLWDGFKSGLGINSPSYLEKAMWAIQDESGNTLDTLKTNARRWGMNLQPTMQRLADPMVTRPAGIATESSNFSVNGPLIGQATIRSDQDIVELARELEKERRRSERARGRG